MADEDIEDVDEHDIEIQAWMKLQEGCFARIWDNDEDAAYDSL
jgi:hypothetical protein